MGGRAEPPPGLEPEKVPTYTRAGEPEPEKPGGIPPRPVREPGYIMPPDERPWLPFAIGAVVLLLCALVLFFGVSKLPTFTAAAVRTTPTEEATIEEETPTEEVAADVTDTPEVTPTTAAPAAAATATPSAVTATAKENVRARGGPGTSYGVLTQLLKGTTVTVLGRNADSSWLQVQLPGNAGKGWVTVDFLDVKGDVNSVAVVQAPPPPAPTKKPTAKP